MKQLLVLLALLTTTFGLAQGGILPFTGIVYTEKGIHAEEITAELEGQTWTSNRLPVNAEFAVELEKPSGLVPEDGVYFPGIEVLLTTLKGDTLGYAADIFGDEGFPGLDEEGLDHLTLRLSFGEESKPGDSCLLKARFFDKKSSAELSLSMMMCIVDGALPLEHTSSTFSLTSWAYEAVATGDIVLSSMKHTFDNETHHRLNRIELDFLAEGITAEEWANGTVNVWYYNEKGMGRLSPIEASVTASEQDGKLAIHTVFWESLPRTNRVRWQNADGSKVVELLAP